MGLLSEAEVLNKLDVRSFVNLSKEKLDALVPMLNNIDPSVVKNILYHNPSLMGATINFANTAISSNDKCTGDTQSIIQSIISVIHQYMNMNTRNLTPEEVNMLTDKLIELAKLSADITKDNRGFLAFMGSLVVGAVVGLAYIFAPEDKHW